MEAEEEVRKDLLPQNKRADSVVIEASQISVSVKRISLPEFQRLPSFSQVSNCFLCSGARYLVT